MRDFFVNFAAAYGRGKRDMSNFLVILRKYKKIVISNVLAYSTMRMHRKTMNFQEVFYEQF